MSIEEDVRASEEETYKYNAARIDLIDHCVKSGSTVVESYADWDPQNAPGTTVVMMVLRDVQNKAA